MSSLKLQTLRFRNARADHADVELLVAAKDFFNARDFHGHPPATLYVRQLHADCRNDDGTIAVIAEVCVIDEPVARLADCSECRGTGRITLFTSSEFCRDCHGGGKHDTDGRFLVMDFGDLPLGELQP